jgi:RNA polymerase sigma-70 factor, ECF subfamily
MSSPRSERREALFDRCYDEQHRAVHAYFLARSGDPEVARDLLQETFLRVWRNVATLELLPVERQRFWLFAVARNLLTDWSRRRATHSSLREELARAAVAGPRGGASAAEVAERREELAQVGRAIGELPEDLRTVLVMQVVGGLTSGQIGELLGRPAGTVRYHLSRARARVAERLGGLAGGGRGD